MPEFPLHAGDLRVLRPSVLRPFLRRVYLVLSRNGIFSFDDLHQLLSSADQRRLESLFRFYASIVISDRMLRFCLRAQIDLNTDPEFANLKFLFLML